MSEVKLPLAVRKNLRDEWEQKKEGLEKEISTILGTEWKVDVDPKAIWAYAEEGSYGHNNLGGCIHAYISDGLIWNLKSFVEKYGPSGVTELNSTASTHTVTLTPDEGVSYCGVTIKDAKLCLLFNPKYLGTNIAETAQPSAIEKAISSAPKAEGTSILSYTTRRDIEQNYTEKIQAILENCQKMLKMSNLKFEPQFEENAKVLAGAKDAPQNWEQNLGQFSRLYFESLESSIKDNKFDSDDMLQETFQEEVSKATIRLRIVDKLEKGTYNEMLLKDGEILLQTTPNYWSVNIHDVAQPLMSLF